MNLKKYMITYELYIKNKSLTSIDYTDCNKILILQINVDFIKFGIRYDIKPGPSNQMYPYYKFVF
jgi:hypothetical protein